MQVSRGQTMPRLQITVDGQQLLLETTGEANNSLHIPSQLAIQEYGDLDCEIQARLEGTGNTRRNIGGIIFDKWMAVGCQRD
jgi:hypothetical protein